MSTKESQLLNFTRKMDVPEWKRTNLKWLKENLAVRNSEHPLFKEAMELIDEIAREQNLIKQSE